MRPKFEEAMTVSYLGQGKRGVAGIVALFEELFVAAMKRPATWCWMLGVSAFVAVRIYDDTSHKMMDHASRANDSRSSDCTMIH